MRILSFIDSVRETSLPLFLLVSGVVMTLAIGAFHIRHPILSLKTALRRTEGGGNSPLKAMCLALAGTIGVGNIAGVALAISVGGAGAAFWMWVSALLVMAVKYCEIVLAVKYRKTDEGENRAVGGAMYYMRLGIGGKTGRVLGVLFAVLCLIDSMAIGGAVQVSAVAETLYEEFRLSPVITGAVLALLCAVIVFGHGKSISDLTMRIVPAMSFLFVGMSLFAIISQWNKLPDVFASIFQSALSPRSGAGGILGFLVTSGIKQGVNCGLLSNEAGCGTAPIAHASSNSSSAAQQGIWGMIEVFIDTIVICTMTALVILLSGVDTAAYHGAALTAAAYTECLGRTAGYLIAVCITLFAFATVICWSYYGSVALGYLTKKKKAAQAYLTVFCLFLFIGAVALPEKVWEYTDIILSVMTAINLFSVLTLLGEVIEITKRELPFAKSRSKSTQKPPS